MKLKNVVAVLAVALGLLTIQPLSAQEFTNHVYRIVSKTLTWNDAKADAELQGGHLATITSQAEANHIQSLGLFGAIQRQAFWLGASDQALEKTWTWVTGEPFTFALWASGQPSNSSNEDYLATTDVVNAHVWNDWGQSTSVLPNYLLEIDDPAPRRATATVQIVNGFVVGFTITDYGYGYSATQPPAVRIRDAAGTGAIAHAVVENGRVVRIEIDNNGRNYTGNATVLIATPPFWPTMSVFVSRITVKMAVVLGRKYQVDVSSDMQTWSPFGDPFVAEEEEITQEFPVTETQKYFRIREVQ